MSETTTNDPTEALAALVKAARQILPAAERGGATGLHTTYCCELREAIGRADAMLRDAAPRPDPVTDCYHCQVYPSRPDSMYCSVACEVAFANAVAVVPPPPDTAAAPTAAHDAAIARAEGRLEGYDLALKAMEQATEEHAAKEAIGRVLTHIAGRAPAPATDDAPTEPQAEEDWWYAVLDGGGRISFVDGELRLYDAQKRPVESITLSADDRDWLARACLRGASPRATAPAPTEEVPE